MDVLILGAARSGIELAKLLLSKNYHVTLVDKNAEKINLDLENIELISEEKVDLTKKYDLVVKSPGIPYNNSLLLKLQEKYQVYSEIEIALRYNQAKVLAITGTNGKTTCTEMAACLMGNQGAKAGNIGIALSKVVTKKHRFLALEVSNFQLADTQKFQVDVAAILNLSPDHLDSVADLNTYYRSKLRIMDDLSSDSYLVINQESQLLMELFSQKKTKAKVIYLSIAKNIQDNYIVFDNVRLINLRDFHLPGKHNLENLMMASVSCYLLGVDAGQIQENIKNFQAVKHRLQFVREINGVKFYNDSKSTNLNALEIALNSFAQKVILLCGGHDKKVDLSPLQSYNDKLKKAIAFGESKYLFSQVFSDCIVVDDLKAALNVALKICEYGDIILLSPGCSSYDQFANFEERGDYFIQLVNNISSLDKF